MDVASFHLIVSPLRRRLDNSSLVSANASLLQFFVPRGLSVRCTSCRPSITRNLVTHDARTSMVTGQLYQFEPWKHSFESSHQRPFYQTYNKYKLGGNSIVRSETFDARIIDASFNPLPDSALLPKLRAILFYAVTAISAIFLIIPMLLQHPLVLLLDRYRRKSQYFVAKLWASVTLSLFFEVKVEGLENLPPPDAPAVYVSNHQSFLDIYTLLTLGRSFKFISKTSIFRYPVIGWAMSMLGVIPLKRMDSRSQAECLKRCLELVKNGSSVFFFPEGTRSKDGTLGAFKKGAFSIAVKTGVPVVSMAIMGTGHIMPSGKENTLNPGPIKVVILKPIKGLDAQELCLESRKQISDVLKANLPDNSR